MNLGDLLKQKIEGWSKERGRHRVYPILSCDLHLLCGANYDEEIFRREAWMEWGYPGLYPGVRWEYCPTFYQPMF